MLGDLETVLLGTFTWSSFAQKLSFEHFQLGTFVWDLSTTSNQPSWIGYLRLGTFDPLVNDRLGTSACQCLHVKFRSKTSV